MEIKFVEDAIVQRAYTGRKETHPWTEFIEELYKHPNKWAEFPDKINASATAYAQQEKYEDIEVIVSGGNNLARKHPDKKQWTVYLRFVPKTPAKNDTPKTPNKKK